MTPAVLILIGVVIGIIVGYTLALVVNYVEYWRAHRAPVELDEQLEAFRRMQASHGAKLVRFEGDSSDPVSYKDDDGWHSL